MNSEISPHVIRLRGPWQRTVVTDLREAVSATLHEPATVTMPGSWQEDLGADFLGVVSYRRMFNRPTGITESTSIQLRLHGVLGNAVIRLNEETLGVLEWPTFEGSFEVTGRLEQRNQLDVEITALSAADLAKHATATARSVEATSGGLVGEVHLEIR